MLKVGFLLYSKPQSTIKNKTNSSQSANSANVNFKGLGLQDIKNPNQLAFIRGLIKADAQKMADAMGQIDISLTNPYRVFENFKEHFLELSTNIIQVLKEDINSRANSMFYLSDGGGSRLVTNVWTDKDILKIRMSLTGNSSSEAKENWTKLFAGDENNEIVLGRIQDTALFKKP